MRKFGFNNEIESAFRESLKSISQYQDPIDILFKQLILYETEIQNQLQAGAPVIERKALHLVNLSKSLLKICRKNTGKPFVPYCLAAVGYLVSEEDAIPDFATYGGFDDDEQVIQAVIQEFELTALIEDDLQDVA